jgi:ligand-binding sensor domain-containing protein
MKEDNGKIVAATENGIFYYTISTGEITKLSKANGLHNIGITAFDYNPKQKWVLLVIKTVHGCYYSGWRSSMLLIFLLLPDITEDKKSTIFRLTEIRL